MKRTLRRLAVVKLMTQRGGFMMNAFVIIYLGSSRFQEHMADRGVTVSVIPVMAGLFATALLVGFLEWKLGMFEAEVGWNWRHMKKGERDDRH